MIQCFVTATPTSERLAEGRSARQVLVASLVLAAARGADIKLVSDPEPADVVIFAEWNGTEREDSDDVVRVMRTPEYRAHAGKTIVHSGKDFPRPLIPGLYPSLPAQWAGVLGCQGAPFLNDPNPFIGDDVGWNGRIRHLASFFGSCAHKPVRGRLLEEGAAGRWRDIAVQNTSDEFIATLRRGDDDGHNALKRLFVQDVLAAKFALCPKGSGRATFRMFEAMQAARAPVVIADGWSAPPGPDWDTFLIRVPERQIAALPKILRAYEPEWKERGEKAQAAWRAFYSPETLGVTVVRQAVGVLDALKTRRTFPVLANLYVQGPRRLAMLRNKLSRRLERGRTRGGSRAQLAARADASIKHSG